MYLVFAYLLFAYLLLSNHAAFAVGDSIATTEGGLAFAIGIAVFILVCLVVVVCVCFKIAGHTQRLRWAIYGGLPSVICAATFSWKLALAIAFGVALWLQHAAELKQRKTTRKERQHAKKDNTE